MENIEEKKISVKIILFSLLGVILSYITKSPYKEHEEEWAYCLNKHIDVPIYYFKINFFGLEIPFKTTLVAFVLLLALGVYWYLTKTDSEIKLLLTKNYNRLKRVDFYNSVLKKTSESIFKGYIQKINFKNRIIINKSILYTGTIILLFFICSWLYVYSPFGNDEKKSLISNNIDKSSNLLKLYVNAEIDNSVGFINGIEKTNPFSLIQNQRLLYHNLKLPPILNSNDFEKKDLNNILLYTSLEYLVTLNDYTTKLASFEAKRNYSVGVFLGGISMIILYISTYLILTRKLKKHKTLIKLIYGSLIFICIFYIFCNKYSEEKLLEQQQINLEKFSIANFQ